jgi:hypothetical protein
MPDATHDTTPPPVLQAATLGQEEWEHEVLPRLPDGWQEQAKDLKAFTRVRELGCAADV